MHIDDLQAALYEGAQDIRVTETSTADIRRRVAAARARGLGIVTAAMVMLGAIGVVSVSPQSEGDDLTRVVSAMGEIRSARFETTGEIRLDDPGETASISGEGVIDLVSGGSQATTRVTWSSSVGTTEQRHVAIGRDRWMTVPEEARIRAGVTQEWVHSTSDSAPMGIGFFSDDRFDVRSALNTMTEFAERIDPIGRETVRGVATTRYRVHIDQAKASARKRDERQTVEMWADGDGVLRRLDVAVYFRELDEPIITSRYELFDFGVEATEIQPPPPELVISDAEFRASMERSVRAQPSNLEACLNELSTTTTTNPEAKDGPIWLQPCGKLDD